MDQNIFNQAFNRATALMNDERFNSIVESKSNAYRKGGDISGSYNDFSAFEAQAFGAPSVSVNETYSAPVFEQSVMAAPTTVKAESKLPAAIRESFEKTPSFTPQQPQTLIDSRIPIPSKPMKTETVSPIIQNSGNIDYSLIRMIVEECINKKINEMASLNESVSTLKGLKFAEGNKIQFLDSKGNLYEGELKLKKRKK